MTSQTSSTSTRMVISTATTRTATSTDTSKRQIVYINRIIVKSAKRKGLRKKITPLYIVTGLTLAYIWLFVCPAIIVALAPFHSHLLKAIRYTMTR